MMAGEAVENKGELKVCMPSGYPADVEPPPQSAAEYVYLPRARRVMRPGC